MIQSNLLLVREISRLIGKMTSMAEAIPPAPLFYHNLQRDVSLSLAKRNQQFETPCQLSPESREELQWWINHLWQWNEKNGKSLLVKKPSTVIESDASLTGWGGLHQMGSEPGDPRISGKQTGT